MNQLENPKHYDSSLEYSITMYDHLPYARDERVCGSDKIALFSGNVIKFYSYKTVDTCIIANQDEKIQTKIKEREQTLQQLSQAKKIQNDETLEENSITE